jgi:ADP-ribose pyrophosphatase
MPGGDEIAGADAERVPFTFVSEEVVATRSFLTLVEERFVSVDGEELTRVAVRHPGAVVAVPVIGDDVLLVRQYRTTIRRYLLEVPAGKRDVAGEDVEAAVGRELEEEIGMRPGRLVPLAEFFNTPGFCDEYTYLFLATELEPVSVSHELRAEERDMRVVRIPLSVAVRMVGDGDIVDAKTICGLLLAARHLGLA